MKLTESRFDEGLKICRTATTDFCCPGRLNHTIWYPKRMKALTTRMPKMLVVTRGGIYSRKFLCTSQILKNSVFERHWSRVLDNGYIGRETVNN